MCMLHIFFKETRYICYSTTRHASCEDGIYGWKSKTGYDDPLPESSSYLTSSAELSVVIAKGYKDECRFNNPQLEVCTFVVN
jgi:hypothetical protein